MDSVIKSYKNEEMLKLHDCLLDSASLNLCGYDPLSPSIYFSLGEAVGAVALFIAAYQMTKSSWRLIFSIRRKWQQWLPLIFLIIGLVMILSSVIVTQIPILRLNTPFNYPVFYEVLGFIFLVFAPALYIIFSLNSKKLFNKKNYENFYQKILREISRLNSETKDVIINVMGSNLSEICSAVSAEKKFKPEEGGEEMKKYSSYARDMIIVVLSEKRIVDHVVTSRIDFLQHFISEVKKNKLRFSIYLATKMISGRLFENENSYLYLQLNRGGLALTTNLYDLIFYDQKVLNLMQPFDGWNIWFLDNKEFLFGEKYLEIYLNSLEKAIEGYWFYSSNEEEVSHLIRGFEKLNDYGRRVAFFSREKNEFKDIAIERMFDISKFLGDAFIDNYEKAVNKNRVSDSDANVNGDENGNYSLTFSYVNALIAFMENVAILKYDSEEIRIIVITATQDLIGPVISDEYGIEKMRRVFFLEVWKKIKANVEKGHFPAILRIYLLIMYFNFKDGDMCRERNKLINYMNQKLKPKILEKEKMANKEDLMEDVLLPDFIVFDRDLDSFCFVDDFGNREELRVHECEII